MISSIDNKITKTCWFVGALFEGSEDQTQRFIDEGVWENNYQDKY
jgi:5-methylcytosine-specific restriction enzyme B